MNRANVYPMLQALLAAILFGISAPIAKLLLGEVSPIPLAALLYLGSGLGLLIVRFGQKMLDPNEQREAPLQRRDWPWLAGATLAGGVAAPIVLLFSLENTPAATASLLLNFETVATTLIAILVFKEAISRRAVLAIGVITVASILLSWNASGEWGMSLAALGILAACTLWGIDNNLTRNISAQDPVTIAMFKGFGAGLFSLSLALSLGNPLPSVGVAVSAMLIGTLSYGLSIVLFVLAMRGMGAARTGALFGTAPLAGVALSFVLFQESPAPLFIVAAPLMLLGMFLLLREDHNHSHVHEELEHEHCHTHFEAHHTHVHSPAVAASESHSHLHLHKRVVHTHCHMPDIHHRHLHTEENC